MIDRLVYRPKRHFVAKVDLNNMSSPAMEDTHETKELPEDYSPTEFDAIVGWARQHYHHRGNEKLRDVVYGYVPQYMSARSKTDKGQVISAIIAKLRRESPSGAGLVRQCPKTKRWCYIGLEKAKDKIGHALRKASQDYRKRHAMRVYPHHHSNYPMAHSTSSSSFGALDCTTTGTPSTASSESDYEDGDVDTSKNQHAYLDQASMYDTYNGATPYYSHPGYQSSHYSYPPHSQNLMYYHHHLSSQQPHPAVYPPYSQDPAAATYYQQYYNDYGNGGHYPYHHPHQSGVHQYSYPQPVPPMPYSEALATIGEKEGTPGTSPPTGTDDSVVPILPKSSNSSAHRQYLF